MLIYSPHETRIQIYAVGFIPCVLDGFLYLCKYCVEEENELMIVKVL